MTMGCKSASISSGSYGRMYMERSVGEMVSLGENLRHLYQEEEVKNIYT